jgi:hypothetical protein
MKQEGKSNVLTYGKYFVIFSVSDILLSSQIFLSTGSKMVFWFVSYASLYFRRDVFFPLFFQAGRFLWR